MKKKMLLMMGVLGVVAFSTTGCGMKPYDVPELVTIEASQTAFLIDLVGDSGNQASFESEELLAEAKVAAKEVQIPHRWIATSRIPGVGEWRPTAKLIIVERTPVTREWNSTKDGGTSAQNQAIYAESKESIGFSVGINASCQIYTEDDAVKFLYSYNNKSLEDIMDTEIRARVESKFVEICAKYTMEEILEQKEEIMSIVREDVIGYFMEKGITITVLGMKDGIEYDDPDIQATINAKFSSAQRLVTQRNENEVARSKAESDAEAKEIAAQAAANETLIRAQAEAEANRLISESLTQELIESQKIAKWNGNVPVITGEVSPFISMDMEDLYEVE